MNLDSPLRLILNEYGQKRIPFLFVFDFLIQQPLIFSLDKNLPLFYDFQGRINGMPEIKFTNPFTFERLPISYTRYIEGFEKIMTHLSYGNSFLVNYTQPTSLKTNLSLDEIFCRANARYKLLIPGKFVVFSPETFVTISESGIIRSFPMKGTIDASIDNAEQIILSNGKEMAEHNTIVDLIRNDLSQVAKEVKVTRFRYIDYLKTRGKDLLQVSSEITGKLGKNYHQYLGDILFSLLPAGSVSGAPKKKTVEIISEVERYNRGYYTGVMGIYDGKALDSAVMIRFIEQTESGFVYKSGGGITINSEAKHEYQELIDKVYVPFD